MFLTAYSVVYAIRSIFCVLGLFFCVLSYAAFRGIPAEGRAGLELWCFLVVARRRGTCKAREYVCFFWILAKFVLPAVVKCLQGTISNGLKGSSSRDASQVLWGFLAEDLRIFPPTKAICIDKCTPDPCLCLLTVLVLAP